MTLSPAASLASLPPSAREAWIASLTPQEAEHLAYRWDFWARPNQLPPPPPWTVWLALAGRGFGKTRLGAEWVRAECESGRRGRVALVGPTAADARDVMVEGESGLRAIAPPWNRPIYEPSKRRLTWPNGALATLYSADEPERLRGPQHDGAWCDEGGSWRYPDAWDQLMFGLRLGATPQVVVTTTPKPTALIKDMLKRPDLVLTRGSSMENRANLAPSFFTTVVAKYAGTRLGRQELEGLLLEDVEGALWKMAWIEADGRRLTQVPEGMDMERIVVGVDPAASSTGAETGIVVCGRGRDMVRGAYQGYVLDDRTVRGSPDEWARAAVTAYHTHRADRIIAEANQGGEMVRQTLRTVDPRVPVTLVHASRGKQTRAEPVAALYEQAVVHHVGTFPALEDQLCTWVPGDPSPDRLDALVWALTELMLGAGNLEPLDTDLSIALAGFTGL